MKEVFSLTNKEAKIELKHHHFETPNDLTAVGMADYF